MLSINPLHYTLHTLHTRVSRVGLFPYNSSFIFFFFFSHLDSCSRPSSRNDSSSRLASLLSTLYTSQFSTSSLCSVIIPALPLSHSPTTSNRISFPLTPPPPFAKTDYSFGFVVRSTTFSSFFGRYVFSAEILTFAICSPPCDPHTVSWLKLSAYLSVPLPYHIVLALLVLLYYGNSRRNHGAIYVGRLQICLQVIGES